jgi:ribosome-binding ATPase YchF (GTP1/OBG family)
MNFQEFLTENSPDSPISDGELRHVEKYLNAVWDHLGIDFEFTKHFFERVNDPRNRKQIQAKELVKIFTDVYKQFGEMIAHKVNPDTEKKFDSVLTDLSTKINSPVVVVWNKEKKELEMVAKTVMRVDHFYTHPNQPRLTVEVKSFGTWLRECQEK